MGSLFIYLYEIVIRMEQYLFNLFEIVFLLFLLGPVWSKGFQCNKNGHKHNPNPHKIKPESAAPLPNIFFRSLELESKKTLGRFTWEKYAAN